MSIQVNLSDLENETKDGIASFVESKLAVKSTRDGDLLAFEDKTEKTHVSKPEVRTVLKRYLYNNKLKKRYRLLNEEGSLKFVKQKTEEAKEEEQKKEEEGK